MVSSLYYREIGSATHTFRSFFIGQPNGGPLRYILFNVDHSSVPGLPIVVAQRDSVQTFVNGGHVIGPFRLLVSSRSVGETAFDFAVDMEVHVGVEKSLLGQDVGVHTELIRLHHVRRGRMVLNGGGRRGSGWGFKARRCGKLGCFVGIGGVDEKDGLQYVPEIAGKVGLELVSHTGDTHKEAVHQVFTGPENFTFLGNLLK